MGSLLGMFAPPVVDTSLTAPEVTLTAAQNVYPPTFSIIVPTEINVETTDIRVQVATDLGFTNITYTHLISPVGSGALDFGLSSIVSGTYYYRFFFEHAGSPGPSSSVWKHGDVTAPTITSANSGSALEGLTVSGIATANEDVTWEVGGADGAYVTIDALTGHWFINQTINYIFGKRKYVWTFIATDYAGNRSTPQTYTHTVINDPANDPAPQWWATDGFNKYVNESVSGTPTLTVFNNVVTGSAGWVRCEPPTYATKFQVEFAVDAMPGTSYFLVGIDGGSTDLTGLTSFAVVPSVVMQFTNGFQNFWVDGVSQHTTAAAIVAGDIVGFRCDITGSIEFYKVHSGTYSTIYTQSFTAPSEVFAICNATAQASVAQITANFGASAFARALSGGYTGY